MLCLIGSCSNKSCPRTIEIDVDTDIMLVSSRQKTSNHLTTEVRSNPTERYTLREKIGQGGFGYVYKAVDNITGELVAAKLINLDEAGDELEDVQQEVNIMSSSTCTQLTKYYASYLSGRCAGNNSSLNCINFSTVNYGL